MRNGKRAPSIGMMCDVVRVFELNLDDAIQAARTPDSWGVYLRNTVFSRTPARVGAQTTQWQPGDQPAGELVEGSND